MKRKRMGDVTPPSSPYSGVVLILLIALVLDAKAGRL